MIVTVSVDELAVNVSWPSEEAGSSMSSAEIME